MSSDISNIVGLAVTGAVAIKTVDLVDDLTKKKKRKSKKRKSDLSFGEFY